MGFYFWWAFFRIIDCYSKLVCIEIFNEFKKFEILSIILHHVKIANVYFIY